MKKQADRRAIVVSAVLTLLILMGTGGALFANRLAAAAGGSPASSPQRADAGQAAVLMTGNSAVATDSEVVAAYQAQLQDAYQALNAAYAQIDRLQAAQQPAAPRSFQEHEDDEAWEHGRGLVLFTGERGDD